MLVHNARLRMPVGARVRAKNALATGPRTFAFYLSHPPNATMRNCAGAGRTGVTSCRAPPRGRSASWLRGGACTPSSISAPTANAAAVLRGRLLSMTIEAACGVRLVA